jgi:RNA polymerase sigma-70 factor (ECF subfamily)
MLMLRIATRDREAFRRLLERHLGHIVAFAARALGDRTGAEDVAQETFLRLWTHASRWQPTARLSTWLHRVALNLCLDRLGRAREVALDDIAEPTDPGPPLVARMQARDIGHHVNAALAQLPAQQRVAITLCHYQGLRNTEAADVMGVSAEALESLLARGRRTLRARLRALLPDLLGEE